MPSIDTEEITNIDCGPSSLSSRDLSADDDANAGSLATAFYLLVVYIIINFSCSLSRRRRRTRRFEC
jgi:hypothetical protein